MIQTIIVIQLNLNIIPNLWIKRGKYYLKKGYNPNTQLIGYLLSGDPTYITNYNNARSLIRKIERDELLEEILNVYLDILKL